MDEPNHPQDLSEEVPEVRATDLPVVYGIPHCDTVAAARRELDARAQPFVFVDLVRQGVSEDLLRRWIQLAGTGRVVNRRSTTWRSLTEAEREQALDPARAPHLLVECPTLVKRPVVEWPDGHLTVGFKNGEFLAC